MTTGLVLARVPGVPYCLAPVDWILADHLTLFKPGGQIMPTTLLLGTRGSKILTQTLDNNPFLVLNLNVIVFAFIFSCYIMQRFVSLNLHTSTCQCPYRKYVLHHWHFS
jgi:hypothetical protein